MNISNALRRSIEQTAKRGPTAEEMQRFPNLYNPKRIKEREERVKQALAKSEIQSPGPIA